MAGKTTTGRTYDPPIAVSAGGGIPEGGAREQVTVTALYVTCTANKTRWIQLFEGPTAPVLGDLPAFRFYQPKKAENFILQFEEPLVFQGGLWWASSKEALLYDPVGASENVVILQVQYF